jgi:GNAT superfamily N-acetyltransferase
MLKIRPAKDKDLPAIMKLFRRVNASLLSDGLQMWNQGYPTEDNFKEDLLAKNLYLATEGGRIIGSVSVSFDPMPAFFDETHDPKKLSALLDKVSAKEEDSFLIPHRLMVDPMDQKKGVASTLISYLKDLYPHRLWIFAVYPLNQKAITFYEKKGFLNMGRYLFEYGPVSEEILFCSTHTR